MRLEDQINHEIEKQEGLVHLPNVGTTYAVYEGNYPIFLDQINKKDLEEQRKEIKERLARIRGVNLMFWPEPAAEKEEESDAVIDYFKAEISPGPKRMIHLVYSTRAENEFLQSVVPMMGDMLIYNRTSIDTEQSETNKMLDNYLQEKYRLSLRDLKIAIGRVNWKNKYSMGSKEIECSVEYIINKFLVPLAARYRLSLDTTDSFERMKTLNVWPISSFNNLPVLEAVEQILKI